MPCRKNVTESPSFSAGDDPPVLFSSDFRISGVPEKYEVRPEPYDARLAGDPVCQGPRGPGGHLGGPGAEGELAPQKGRRRRVEGWLGPGLRGGTQAEAWRGAVELGAQEKPSSTPPASMTAFPSPIVQRALYPGMSTPGGRFRGPQCAHLWALVGPWGWRACVCVPSGVQVGPHFSLALPSTPGLVYSVPLLLASVCLWPLSCVCVCVCVCVQRWGAGMESVTGKPKLHLQDQIGRAHV